MKDDVKSPEGEIGAKIEKLFRDEEKDTSAYHHCYIETVNTNSLSDVIILTAMGEETAIEAKEAPRGSN